MPGPYRVIIPLISTLLKKEAPTMRNRHLAAIPLAALLLTACASATDTAPLTTPTPEPTATATPTPAAGDFAWLNRHDSSFNSGDAYYEMVYRNHGGLLLKTDYATAAQTVACTVPGCTHDSADCPAWFPGRYQLLLPLCGGRRGLCAQRAGIPHGSNLGGVPRRIPHASAGQHRPHARGTGGPLLRPVAAAKRRAAGVQADRRRQDLHRPARRVCGLRV